MSTAPDGMGDPSLEARLTRLEQRLSAIEARLTASGARTPPHPAALPRIEVGAAAEAHPLAAPARVATLPELRLDGQFWLNKLGISLVLVAVALLFRYSIDRGWLTPLVRVGFGLALGLALLAAGVASEGAPRRFRSVLYGGAVAVFYIVGFAAFYLYELLSYGPAFVVLGAVTILGLGLAVRKDEEALALLGALGGLGVPLVLGIERGTPQSFALYTCSILAGTTALYLVRRWRALFWLSTTIGWLLLVLYAVTMHDGPGSSADRVALGAATAFAWLATALLPVVAEARGWPQAERRAQPRLGDADLLHWHGVAVLPVLAALGVAALVWSPSPQAWGWLALGAAALYGAGAWLLRARNTLLAAVLALSAALLLAVGTVTAFSGKALLLILAGEGIALLLLAARGGSAFPRALGHLLFGCAAAWVLVRLGESTAARPADALVNLAVIAGALAVSSRLPAGTERLAYRAFAHLAFLGWLWAVLAPLPGGAAFVSIAWGAYAVLLLLYALRTANPALERAAIATLLLVVAKLFLVDLAALEAIWRVLLFLGLGLVFLVLSYALQGWWRPAEAAASTQRRDDAA